MLLHGIKNCFKLGRKTSSLLFSEGVLLSMINNDAILRYIARIISPNGSTLGTAFLASSAGHLLTCWHVIRGNESVSVIFENEKEPVAAKVIHDLSNPQEDIAVLQITPKRMTPPPLGIDWEINDLVWSYGYQYENVAISGFPVTGNISGNTLIGVGQKLIVISGTNIQKGLSGAPLLHINSGRIVGIVNARLSKDDIGFAIPIKTVLDTWPELNEHVIYSQRRALQDIISLFQILGYSIEQDKRIDQLPSIDLYGEMHIGVASHRIAMQCINSYSEIKDDEIKDFLYGICVPLYSQKLIQDAFVVSVNNQRFNARAIELAKSIGIHLVTFNELETNLINFSHFIESYIDDFQNHEKLTLDKRDPIIDQLKSQDLYRFYVDLRCRDVLSPKKDNEYMLIDYVKDWLHDENRKYLSILGDYGTGKTSFALQIAYQLAKEYQARSSDSRIPLYFPLRDYDPNNTLRSFILDKLSQYQISVSDYRAFEKMAQSGRLLLIFDGFDELVEATDQSTAVLRFSEISRLARGRSKIILTCRTEYFKSEKQSVDLLVPETMTPFMLELSKRGEYSVIELLEFNEQQILELISRHTEDSETYWKRIKSIYNLEDLATRPILLTMILQTYPKLIQVREKITAADLYQLYTEYWLDRDKWRSPILSTEDRFGFAEELAWQMYMKSTLAIRHDELLLQIEAHFEERYTRDEIRKTLEAVIRTSSFLTRNRVGAFTFVHKSFMEFLVARRLTRELNSNKFDLLEAKIVPIAILSFLINMISQEGLAYVKSVAIESNYSTIVKGACMDILLMLGETITNVPWIFCVAFNPNNKEIATGGADCVVRIWNLDKIGEKPIIIPAHKSWIRSIQYSPRDNLLATSSWDGTVKFWETSNWTCVGEFNVETRIASIRFNEEGDLLAIGSYDNAIRIWSINDNRLLKTFPDHFGVVWDVYFSPNGKWVASACTDRIVRIWDVESGESVATLRGHQFAVSSVCFSRSGELLFTGDWQGEIIAWDCRDFKIVYRIQAHNNKIGEIHTSSIKEHFASSADDLKVRIWDCKTGDLIHVFSDATYFTPNLQYSHDGHKIAVGSLDLTLRIWDVGTFQLLHQVKHQRLS